jgi:hypothetical protein
MQTFIGNPGRRSPEVIFEGIKGRNCLDSSIVSLWRLSSE